MKKVLYWGVPALLLVASHGMAAVKTDYDHSAQFERYQTFAWKMPAAPAHGMVDNSIVSSRIENAVDSQLTQRGMHLDDRRPDVYLTYHVAARNERTVAMYPGWGYGRRWGWGPGWGGNVMVDRYTRGTLILDMVDAHTGRLVWRAVGDDTGSNPVDATSQKKIDKLVGAAFKHYPPKRNG